MLHDKRAGDGTTHRVADDVGAADAQVVEQACDILDHGETIAGRVVRLVALTVAAAVERDDTKVAR
jgi:hypothetical protein